VWRTEALKTERILLIGEGEPLLHPTFLKSFRNARSLDFMSPCIPMDIVWFGRIESILDSALICSRWASGELPEIYEKNYPGTDPTILIKSFEGLKSLNSIKKQRKNNLPSVFLRHPINKHNFQSIDAFVELAWSTGCEGLLFTSYASLRRQVWTPSNFCPWRKRFMQFSEPTKKTD